MARWQLTEPHYLNVPGGQFEDKTYGDRKVRRLSVPTFLDPNQESDCNYREMVGTNMVETKLIVCLEGKGEPRDIAFTGHPTPGMLPLDDEAREISAQFKDKWTPTQGLDDISQAESFTQKLLMGMMSDMTEMKQQVKGGEIEGMSDLMKSISEMMKMQTQLLAALSGKPIPTPEPLPEPAPATPELRKFEPAGKGPTSLRDARRLASQAREPEPAIEE